MLKQVLHIGLTVKNLDRSLPFYRDVLGLTYQGEMLMEGEETDRLFARSNARARIAYLKGTDELISPSIELIQFTDLPIEEQRGDLFRTSISEICFYVEDIHAVYHKLLAQGVDFLSEPQVFDFRSSGFGQSLAVYFRDPDGIILELIQPISE